MYLIFVSIVFTGQNIFYQIIVIKQTFKWHVTRSTFLFENSKLPPIYCLMGPESHQFWHHRIEPGHNWNLLNHAIFLDFWFWSYFSVLMHIYFHVMKCNTVSSQTNRCEFFASDGINFWKFSIIFEMTSHKNFFPIRNFSVVALWCPLLSFLRHTTWNL